MKLAVSNIGWTRAEDATILPRLAAAGAEAVEVAPGRLFDDPAAAGPEEAARIRAAHAAAGLPLVSMQALLFGRPDLALFEKGEAGAAALADHLERIIALAGTLGCRPLVFGSPGNRRRGALDGAAARAAARPVLTRLAAAAAAAGSVLCLEPNARTYGCDFVTTLAEAAEMVQAVAHPGLALVADSGNMMLEGEAPAALRPHAGLLAHLHLSAPHLGPVAPHASFATELIAVARGDGYDGLVTLEMRPGSGSDPTEDLLRATDLLAGLVSGRGREV
jgi:D-psicose/D-tagatose/L-ribulose 3-epimerase